jgi:hypothetical protein
MAEQLQRNPGGRPRLAFDLRQVEELGKIQSTLGELAAVLGCGLSTVKDRLQNDGEFSAAYEKGREAGKSSLRRLQWKSAVAGNVVMQIWLGKQYLGQQDQQSVEVSRPSHDEQWARLARTEKGREALAGLSTHLAEAMRALEEQQGELSEVIEAETIDLSAGHVVELPALPEPGEDS